jgi:DNA modification methylase
MKPVPYYDQDGITIYHGDCAQVLPFLDPVDLLLTDPPYGIGTGGNKVGVHGKVWDVQEWDKQTTDYEVIKLAASKARISIIWGGNYYPLPPSRCWLSWDKNQPDEWISTAHFELAWTNMDRNAHRWRKSQVAAYANMGKEHPSQKPIELMHWCIKEAGGDKVGTILDPFMGSGTTLVAAKNQGKRAIGIEQELKYCEIAVRRLAQQTLFQCEQPNAEGSRAAGPDPKINETNPKGGPVDHLVGPALEAK